MRVEFTPDDFRVALATTVVVFGFDGANLQVLIAQKVGMPYEGATILPSTVVHPNEDVEATARGLVERVTGKQDWPLEQLNAHAEVYRNRVGRVENDAATGALTVPSKSRIQWLRGGSAPEAFLEPARVPVPSPEPDSLGSPTSSGVSLASISARSSGSSFMSAASHSCTSVPSVATSSMDGSTGTALASCASFSAGPDAGQFAYRSIEEADGRPRRSSMVFIAFPFGSPSRSWTEQAFHPDGPDWCDGAATWVWVTC